MLQKKNYKRTQATDDDGANINFSEYLMMQINTKAIVLNENDIAAYWAMATHFICERGMDGGST